MAKKIVRLTESDLTRLVKRIIKEQTFNSQAYTDKTGYHDPNFSKSIQAGYREATQQIKREEEFKKREEERKKKENDEKQKREDERALIRKNQIKEGTPMSSIFTTNMGGVKINNENEFVFNTFHSTTTRKNTVKKEIGYSVDSGEFKTIRKDYDFAKMLDGGSEFNDVRNAIKILDDKVRKRTATKQGDTYTFKSKDGQKNIMVKPIYFITTTGVVPPQWYPIKTDVNGLINDTYFIKQFNSRVPM